ncbi:MAG: hypothetical protein U0R64_05425 [Candidatus Nanopelagicales bacterium]
MSRPRTGIIVLSVAAATVALGGCSAPMSGNGDAAVSQPPAPRKTIVYDGEGVWYADLQDMYDQADLVVVARLHDPTSTTLSRLSKPKISDPDSPPMQVWQVTVESVIKGAPPGNLRVSRFDTRNPAVDLIADGVGDTTPGATAVLFLREGPFGIFYVSGVDEGYAEITADTIQWRTGRMAVRSPVVRDGGSGSRMATPPPTVADTVTTVEALKEAVR